MKKFLKACTAVFAVVFGLMSMFFISCSAESSDGDNEPRQIEIEPSTLELAVGDKEIITVVSSDDATNKSDEWEVEWETSNKIVNYLYVLDSKSSVMIYANDTGTCTVTVKLRSNPEITATCIVTVKSIVIPASVKSIESISEYDSVRRQDVDKGAFQCCSKLETVTFAQGSQLTKIGARAFASTALSSINLPEGVVEIGKNAFAGAEFTSFRIPSTVTYIAKYAFYDCRKLTSITIPASVTEIGPYAFSGCSCLKSATFTDKEGWKYYYGSNLKDADVTDDATANATNLKSTNKWLNGMVKQN